MELTLNELYDEIPRMRSKFKDSLYQSKEKTLAILHEVLEKITSDEEYQLVLENLKEVAAEYLSECLEEAE